MNCYEFFQVNSSDKLFHWRRIVRGINFFLYQGVFPWKFLCPNQVICVDGIMD
jgi:hypothetical protein